MRVSIVSSLFQKKMFLQVVTMIEKDIMHSKQKINPKILYYLALSYTNLKEYKKALEIIDKVIASNLGISYNYQCQMLKGYLYVNNRDYELAEMEFESMLMNGYESAMIYGALGHIAYCQKHKEKSIEFLERALELDSDNLNVLNSMSFILSEYNMQLERAVSYIERVVTEQPKNASYLDTYGCILFKMHRYEEAEKILTQAFLIKSHPMIRKHLDEVQVAIALQE